MEQISIQVSPKQMSNLKKGKKVRVKKAMDGGGINLIVNPSNYSLLTNSFTRNKGMDLSLSNDEILANTEMSGNGVFGDTFDKGVKKVLGKRGKKVAYEYARNVLNPLAKGAITAGLATGGVMLGGIQPELIPFIPAGVGGLSYMISDYIDNPKAYQSSKKNKSLASKYLEDQALGQINSQLGTNMGNLSRAGVQKAIEDKASQKLTSASIEARNSLMSRITNGIENVATLSPQEKQLLKGTRFEYLVTGSGLYAGSSGSGLYLGRQGGAIVGCRGKYLN